MRRAKGFTLVELLGAKAVPATGVIPAQKIWSRLVGQYSAGINGQATYDFYRHGKNPPVQVPGDTGYYAVVGGKYAYNILYCDGHEATSTDPAEGYRAARLRFPE
jgi:prepilin-type processing-associated H-X9-DG protein